MKRNTHMAAMVIFALAAVLAAVAPAIAQVIVVPRIKGRLVDVQVDDGAIRMPGALKKGWATFRITNTGQEYHSLTFMGRKKVQSLPVAIPPGHAAFLSIKLHEGLYTVWCQMRGHADGGERVSVVVYDD